MEEKRKNKRFPVDLNLHISSLFKQDNVKVENIQEPIEVTDVSRTGIGFKSKSILPLNYYFNAKIILGEKPSVLYCVVQIIRTKKEEDNNIYGCEFIGMAPVLSYIFDEFEEEWNKKEHPQELP